MNIPASSGGARSRRSLLPVTLLALVTFGCHKDVTSPAAAARQLAFTTQPSGALADSNIAPVVAVTIEDGSGNVVTASTAEVTLALASNPTGANLSGPASTYAVNGVATFTYLSIDRAGTYTLTATATAAALTAATSASFTITYATNGLFTSVASGGSSTCGISTTANAYCWGNNNLGQLGNATTSNQTTPSRVAGGLSFSSVSVGSLQSFACGLTTAGAGYCWGYNDYGQLGNGNYVNSTSPSPVTGNLTFTALSAGSGGQACGLVAGGSAYCWGYNGSGQLGNGSVGYTSTPSPVSGGVTFTAISAGQSGETCAVATGGAAWCWGYNADGELGDGTALNRSTPVAVKGGLSFSAISTGFASSCGVTTSGAAYCWGDNTYGELGNGNTTNSLVPVAVSGGLTFQSVSVGDAFACGLTTAGTAYCWGFGSAGQLGNGAAVGKTTPTAVFGGLAFSSLSAGYASACATTPGGAGYCWGDNTSGQLGNSYVGQALTPVLIVTPQ